MENNNDQNPVDGQNPSTAINRQQPPAQGAGQIMPPAQVNNQQPARSVRDYLAEDLEGLNPAVVILEFEAEHFEVKPVMFNMLHTIGQFGGSPVENARQHLKSFLEICTSFKIQGVSNDILKLKLFPYLLRDKTKAWWNNLPPDSYQSWIELSRGFLAKFSYSNMTDKLRSEITSFRQEDDEAMHEAWERYRDLCRRCPMHGLPKWTQVSIFYNSINTPTRMMLDASANGTLLDKPPREGLEILEKLAINDYQHPTTRRGTMRRGTTQLDSSDAILAQISNLTNIVKNMQKNAMTNTYNPSWKKHPNFSWQNQNNTLNPITSNQQGYQNQPRQNLQLNQPRQEYLDEIVELRSCTQVPRSCTQVPGESSHINSSDKFLETPPKSKQGEITVTNSKVTSDTDIPAHADIPAEAGKDHTDPPTIEEEETAAETPQPKNSRTDKLEEIRPPPPLPQRLKKQKQEYQFNKFFEILKQVHINLPLVEALQQMPNYAKFLKDMVTRKTRIGEFETAAATEACLAMMHNKVPAKKTNPGSFTIPCSKGNNYTCKAL
ncbi:hypothetical protein V6N11_018681 [Hibiscus sabdariffa]|uniref:Retrotransposon gag domain-containing protein n=1 Tax=Hibiscus sabdariffa TaxID=183260 RepID=A0ABR2QT16_9ROSI